MRYFRLLAAGAFAALAGTAVANDKGAAGRSYPTFEKQYIKRYTHPQINCGACFGYYPTQWKSFNEACGQPDLVYGAAPAEVKKPETAPTPKVPDATPPKTPDPVPTTPMTPTTPPKTSNPVPVPVDPKPIDPKPIDPKKPGDSGKSSQVPAPLPAKTVSITVPVPPVPVSGGIAPIPLIPEVPAVNVK
jgi:hypothetical protein